MTLESLNQKAAELVQQYKNPEAVVFKPIYSTSNSNVLSSYLDKTPDRILSQQLGAWLIAQNANFEYELCCDDYTELEVELC